MTNLAQKFEWFDTAKNKIKSWSTKAIAVGTTVAATTLSVSASSVSGATTQSAISDVGNALTGILGYISGVTSTILGDDLWIFGMGFFTVSFICGLVMYFFRVGRR